MKATARRIYSRSGHGDANPRKAKLADRPMGGLDSQLSHGVRQPCGKMDELTPVCTLLVTCLRGPLEF